MKNITSKVQRLSQRAAELKHMVEGVPPKLAEMRDVVKEATGHVQKLRADVMASVATLRAENDTQLVEALKELDGSADVLVEAGCLLDRVDMDLGPTRRVIVHLDRAENVDARRLHALMEANRASPVLHAVLSAILKADELSEKVELEELTFTKLSIDVGLIPSVRIGWTTNARRTLPAASAVPPITGVPHASALGTTPITPLTMPTSFFEPRASPVASVPATSSPAAEGAVPAAIPTSLEAPAIPVTPVAPPVTVSTAAPSASGDWRKGALDRFKKMPDLTKRSG